MPQYAILIYETETPGEIPPEVMEANLSAGAKIAAMGAKVIHEQALQPSANTRTIHKNGLVTDGPFIETKEVLTQSHNTAVQTAPAGRFPGRPGGKLKSRSRRAWPSRPV
jgi:hypothetical protein